MLTFLQKLATKIYSDYPDLSRICIVFQNRRAGLYFRKYLAGCLDKPVWLPEIIAIEDLVDRFSGLKTTDQLTLLVHLYDAYKDVEKNAAWPFTDFIAWGNRLLTDFDEIDQYLVDGEAVFTFLDEIKAIKNWNLDGKELTKTEKEYLHFYNSLAKCYTGFRNRLLNAGLAYPGLAFRHLLSDINQFNHQPWDKIIFAGFNALTPAEKKLAEYLTDIGKAEFFWDADEYYLNDKSQEAGYFLRQIIKKQGTEKFNWIENHFKNDEKEISVVGVPGNIGQVKLAGQLIEEIQSQEGVIGENKLAVVLIDEGLLIPLLNSLPSSTRDYNVTMGYPIQLTPAFSMVDSLLTLFDAEKQKTDVTGNTQAPLFFFRSDVLRVINHPYLNSIGKTKENFNLLKTHWSAYEFCIYIKRYLPGFNGFDFINPERQPISGLAITLFLQEFVTNLLNYYAPDDPEQDTDTAKATTTEYLYRYALLFEKLISLLDNEKLQLNVKSLRQVIKMLSSTLKIPFYGEPLSGIQIMGMLETRTLDFENIILLTANEDILPKGKTMNSFITSDIRHEFNLPGYRENNALFAYHFYRLLQRASKVWLLYNTESGTLGGGEESRFIKQLIYEMPFYNPKLKIYQKTLSFPFTRILQSPEIRIQKDSAILEKLQEKATSGFSPTVLSTYLKCPLRFYFSQVLGLEEPEEPEASVDSAMLGQAVHEVLNLLFSPFLKGISVNKDQLREKIPDINRLVQDAFAKLIEPALLDTGQNLLSVRVAENMLRNIIKQELKSIEVLEKNGQALSILALEQKFRKKLVLELPGLRIREVIIKGTLDRIDSTGLQTRIIDYKTGKVDPKKELRLDSVGDLRISDSPDKALQLLIYSWLIFDTIAISNPNQQIITGIISALKTSAYFMPLSVGPHEVITNSIIEDTTEMLVILTSEILNPEIPFLQQPDVEKCMYCPYIAICGRQ